MKDYFLQIKEKMESIMTIPRLGMDNPDPNDFQRFEHIRFDVNGRILYMITDIWNDEIVLLDIALEEIDKPLSYFEEKFAKEILEDAEREKKRKESLLESRFRESVW